MTNINLFGGPGCGKSVNATLLYANMKMRDSIVEYVHEYAKGLVYSEDFSTLGDQLMVLSNQHHGIYKLRNKVDYTINDGPFLLSLVYTKEDSMFDKESFRNLIIDLWNSYNNLNIFIERNQEHQYEESGRNETLEESLEVDNKIKQTLNENNIKYTVIKNDENTVKNILNLIKDYNE